MTGAVLISAGVVLAEEVTFTFEPSEGSVVASVTLRGSFNDWGETPMELQDDGTWTATLDLDGGEHQYKFFINGQWPGSMETGLDGYPVDPTADGYVDDGVGGLNAIRVVGGGAPAAKETFAAAPALAGGSARIHYHRPKGGYDGWGLHVWKDSAEEYVTWSSPLEPTGRDDYGLYWDVALTDGAAELGFIVHKGDTKDPGPDMSLPVSGDGGEVWLVSGSPEMHASAPDVTTLALGDLTKLRAHWVDRRTIAWKVRHAEGSTYRLHASPDAALTLSHDGVTGGESFALERAGNKLPPELVGRFPHLAGHAALVLSDADLARVPELLKGQLAVSVTGADGKLEDAVGLQIPGVLDDLFAYDGPLGLTWDGGAPTISVWAPTAKQVRLHIFGTSASTEPVDVVDMVEADGVWSATGDSRWNMLYYLFEVGVYVPRTGRVEWSLVTDPYSRGLSRNSTLSQVVNLDDPALKPQGWDDLQKPPLEAPEDIVIYELHVRDYSANDPTVAAPVRGTFLAFALPSNGATHLRALAEAGLTHVHLLPAFDIATIDENKANWDDPGDLTRFPPDSDQQQAAIARISGSDPYNWGYDPFHFGTPEGSYSTVPDGPARITEFRQMVTSLSGMGLRVVMDVVYNHTNSSGMSDMSVFDKIVPGYYHRLNHDGFVETSTCCQNTATEHYMMERFMVDDVVHWAVDYKVDGFRFDLMGHHMKSNMLKVRDALRALTVEEHGVDGNAIYLYGEGWDFGEVAGGRRGENAVQFNMAGTGIGTFNDRIRDAVRGGSPFADRRDQGFATGLYTDPNGFNGSGGEERGRLLGYMNRIRFGMTGNLRDYLLVDHNGREILGGQYEGVGYATDPQEAINYVSAHDNETFFDKIQYAAPVDATLDDRVRMQNLALSVVALGQGIPFFHAGSDMLRSKSMEADSYNSGDWFNRLDWSYESNNFGVGLPSAEKNRDRWDIIRPLLAREDITPGRDEIMRSVHHFRELLRIRKSSLLFRLRTSEEVQVRTRFHNTGPDQTLGLIVMSVSDEAEGLRPIDTNYRSVIVFLNGTNEPIVYDRIDWKGKEFELHPVQQSSHDDVVRSAAFDSGEGAFTIPARTAAVFVEPR